MAAISNFRIRNYITGGAVFEWTSEPALIAHLTIYSSASSDPGGVWIELAELDKTDTSFIVSARALTPGHVWVKLEARLVDGTIEYTVVNADVFGSLGTTPVPIAVDLNGVPRSLKVDSGGNLIVAGALPGSGGTGDASATLQNQQIALATTANGKLDTLNTSISAVVTKLDNVGIRASQVADMKTVSVQNFPASYPDPIAQVALSNIAANVARDATLSAISTKLDPLLRSEDLSFTAGALNVSVSNMPADFPDAAGLAKTDLILTQSVASNIHLTDLKSKLDDTNLLIPTVISAIDDVKATVQVGNTILDTTVSPKLDQVRQDIVSALAPVATEATIGEVKDALGPLVKSADLPKNSNGDILVAVQNMPNDFPDTASLAVLGDLKTELQRLDTSNVTISGPLPAGTNALGTVAVTSSALPVGAATEATLAQVKAKLAELYTEIGSAATGTLKSRISELKTYLSDILDALKTPYSNIQRYRHEFLNVSPLTSVSTGGVLLGNCSKTTIGIVSTGTQGCIVSIQISIDGTNYFPMEGYSSLVISGAVYKSLTFDSILPYIKLSITNPSASASIPKLQVEIRGRA